MTRHFLVLKKVFAAIDPAVMEACAKATPKGIPARRAWYLISWLSGPISRALG
jgi:hypothetical protein